MNSLQGKLLVSSPALVDPSFRKTVVLIAHHDEDGAMGLVLSRPSDVPAADAVPALDGFPGAGDPVFVGGPVQPEAFMALAEFEDVEDAAAPIFGSVGFMPAETEPDDLSILRLRVFAGYAGWGKLRDEWSGSEDRAGAAQLRRLCRYRPKRAGCHSDGGLPVPARLKLGPL